MPQPTGPKLFGLLAEYDNPDALVAAIKRAREAGYTKLDGYTPYGVAEVADALGFVKIRDGHRHALRRADRGDVSAFLMQWWTNGIDYPLQHRRPGDLDIVRVAPRLAVVHSR